MVYIEGISLIGPGLNGWLASRDVLAGKIPYINSPIAIPPLDLLPSAERRRVGLPVKLALALGWEAIHHAQRDITKVLTVFASSNGDGDNMHHVLETLATSEREVSPTRFHNSVHNAPAGYWSIATQSSAASTSIANFDASFAAGLLEAVAQTLANENPVALISYDTPYPQPIHAVRTIHSAFGVALVLSKQRGERSIAALEISAGSNVSTSATNAVLAKGLVENIAPAARALPLLSLLATATAGEINLEYIPGQSICVGIQPC